MSRHYNLRISENPDILFYGDIGNGEQLNYPPKTTRIFLTGENIQANWNEADYALTHERVWNERHWRAPLWRQFYDPDFTKVDRDFSLVQKRVDRFCNFIYSNDRAKERIEFFHKLSSHKHVDSGGRLLNNIGGPVQDKRAYLARCKFTIAFENESHPGYATEKIIEPLLMGSIPIYWGDPQIEDDFNPDCLINVHRFRSFEDVIQRVLEIDESPTLWQKYISAPIFRGGKLPACLTDEAFLNFITQCASKGPQISYLQRKIELSRLQYHNFYKSLKGYTKNAVRGIANRYRH